jgi:hypothetical protein
MKMIDDYNIILSMCGILDYAQLTETLMLNLKI